MRRREQREHIFKLLFMTEFNSKAEMGEQLSFYFDGLEELADGDEEYMREKYRHVLEHLGEIDTLLEGTSKGWKTKRMNRVDLTALRLAVYELKFDSDVPVGVAINEAVELAKSFGGETSGSFVNGILGKIANGGENGTAGDEAGTGAAGDEAGNNAAEAAPQGSRGSEEKIGFGNSAGKIVVVHQGVDRAPARKEHSKEEAGGGPAQGAQIP